MEDTLIKINANGTIQILKGSNSTPLRTNPALMPLRSLRNVGLKRQKPSVLYLNPEEAAELTSREAGYAYANKADILNIALFGTTAKAWREKTGETKKNMRDFASVEQLIVLVNLESMNADLIRQGVTVGDRLKKLCEIAYYQMESLKRNHATQKLAEKITGRIKGGD